MPSKKTAKTASARKLRLLVALVLLIVILTVPFLQNGTNPSTLKTATGQRYFLETVNKSAELEKGLSHRDSLPNGKAMLFVFSKPGRRCFWMKDMRFPLDILWIDNNKKIIHKELNVSPLTYPKKFCPNQPAQYVLELNAGQAEPNGLMVESLVSF